MVFFVSVSGVSATFTSSGFLTVSGVCLSGFSGFSWFSTRGFQGFVCVLDCLWRFFSWVFCPFLVVLFVLAAQG